MPGKGEASSASAACGCALPLSSPIVDTISPRSILLAPSANRLRTRELDRLRAEGAALSPAASLSFFVVVADRPRGVVSPSSFVLLSVVSGFSGAPRLLARPRRGETRAVVIEVLLSALVAMMSSLIVFLTVQLLRL
jgi:hypothetical protein